MNTDSCLFLHWPKEVASFTFDSAVSFNQRDDHENLPLKQNGTLFNEVLLWKPGGWDANYQKRIRDFMSFSTWPKLQCTIILKELWQLSFHILDNLGSKAFKHVPLMSEDRYGDYFVTLLYNTNLMKVIWCKLQALSFQLRIRSQSCFFFLPLDEILILVIIKTLYV